MIEDFHQPIQLHTHNNWVFQLEVSHEGDEWKTHDDSKIKSKNAGDDDAVPLLLNTNTDTNSGTTKVDFDILKSKHSIHRNSLTKHPALHRGLSWSFVHNPSASAEDTSNPNIITQHRHQPQRHPWSIGSETLLEITYRPAYQALPSYTATKHPVKRFVKRFVCPCLPGRRVHFVREVYTHHDVSHWEFIEEEVVKGIGPCHGIKVYLFPKDRSHILGNHVHTEAPTEITPNNDNHPAVTFLVPSLPQKISEKQEARCPPLIWKAKLPSDPDVAIQNLTIFDGSLYNESLSSQPSHVYLNGWQSWSFTGTMPRGELKPTAALPKVFSKAFNRGGKLPPPAVVYLREKWGERSRWLHGLREKRRRKRSWQLQSQAQQEGVDERSASYFSRTTFGDIIPVLPKRFQLFYKSEMMACITAHKKNEEVEQALGPALVLGWLSQHHQFGAIAMDRNLAKIGMHSSCDAAIATKEIEMDYAFAQILDGNCYEAEPMASYLEIVSEYNNARIPSEPLSSGWCSWYHYFENIQHTTLKNNLTRLHEMKQKLASNMAVIDDGYMTFWGDWDSFKPSKFSTDSLKDLAKETKNKGLRPGLWLAPFACDKGSKLARDHPDWIIRNDPGAPANSANCGKFFYGLDATNPEVRAYAASIVKRAVHEWGYEVLKLDFLYASCLAGNGKYEHSLTRAQTMHLAMKVLREAAGGNVFIIGCGCPIGPAIGLVDGMRISADTGPTWKATFPLPWWDFSTLPCLFAMIRNTLTRMSLGYRLWHNDPDCILLGTSTRLTIEEVKSAATIVGMSGGMLLLSDDLGLVPHHRLEVASKISPVTGASAIPMDLHYANDVLPSTLRIKCSDKIGTEDSVVDSSLGELFHENTLAKKNDSRSCIRMTDGLGEWFAVSLSNWMDVETISSCPFYYVENDSKDKQSECHISDCYHAFSFWDSSYSWVTRSNAEKSGSAICRRLKPHESEIFHFKRVTPGKAQYIGSDLHFSCGYEIKYFETKNNSCTIILKQDVDRDGHIFLSLPVNHSSLKVTLNKEKGNASIVCTIPRNLGIIVKIRVKTTIQRECKVQVHF